MFIKEKCPISATPSGSDAMYRIFFYKCLMHIASGLFKTVFLISLNKLPVASIWLMSTSNIIHCPTDKAVGF